MPICDGAHKTCVAAEKPGMLYQYDPVTKRVISEQPDTEPPPLPPPAIGPPSSGME